MGRFLFVSGDHGRPRSVVHGIYINVAAAHVSHEESAMFNEWFAIGGVDEYVPSITQIQEGDVMSVVACLSCCLAKDHNDAGFQTSTLEQARDQRRLQ